MSALTDAQIDAAARALFPDEPDAEWQPGTLTHAWLETVARPLVRALEPQIFAAAAPQPEQQPAAWVVPTAKSMPDGSMEDGPEYIVPAKEASGYERRIGSPLYAAPAPAADVRELVEALRGMRAKYGEYACEACDRADAAIAKHGCTQ